ncbi:hypothetical protein P152DRAFT_456830 [Eremomyces bilateralis CBS 781.70]|uniref:Uncharacterized protein n=1 Tax=Eremomyces bilateralis CBS 781.70 TaxID=1392243 RepID=A0A6G1G999_9PEZI|nr:uncharacterized protein P152DRAFT_456830 [Eremomyces bilateralis CBS 781.70]KAF1814562.1 hypothetical protein P152DRAFT_456830 [Eremomyces bilateralis CBS 781.70]
MAKESEYDGIAAKFAKAKARREQEESQGLTTASQDDKKVREYQFTASHGILVALLVWFLILHALGIYLFTSGFLLTRLVLNDRSQCAEPPVLVEGYEVGSIENGCWHPKSFDKAVVIVVDALRYDFTVPFQPSFPEEAPHHFHNALPFFYQTAKDSPENAILLPFIADPPTTTLQRLKGLTTGTLPTFIDAGSNFAGTAIDEDNLIEQLYHAGKRVVHLGDDTWHALFPGYFEPNLTKPYDSFNVWDLHTVDNGVTEHLLPLLDTTNSSKWDVIVGHYLGVDHAGHRYGPDHPAMAAKLRQMNDVLTNVAQSIDDSTLLVVMGDHGMDQKGDHGGESADEVEAAIWFYSKRPVFGRSSSYRIEPPATAKERPVAQIDLVPTLSLLLGMPIPFNNLGAPIEEAFIGLSGNQFGNLAAVYRLTTAQIGRYMSSYSNVRKLDESTTAEPQKLWKQATASWDMVQRIKNPGQYDWRSAYQAYSKYQKSTLHLCHSLWARFDMASMVHGIEILVLSLGVLIVYACGITGDRTELNPILLVRGALAMILGAVLGASISFLVDAFPFISTTVYLAALGGVAGISSGFWYARRLRAPVPKTLWSFVGVAFTLLLSIGFASNSFTIWEDRILLMFLASFGVMMFGSSMRQRDVAKRTFGCYYSILFVVLTRIASLSMLCREEQMPYCKTTFYASATSSTSAAWQLLIPFVTAIVLPEIVKSHFKATGSYHGSAVLWIGVAFRIGLLICALFWSLDIADDKDWLDWDKARLKTVKMVIAQIALVIALPAGYSTFSWCEPFLSISNTPARAATKSPEATGSIQKPPTTPGNVKPTESDENPKQAPIVIHGYSNLHGTRYFLLVTIWVLTLLLLYKPMGSGALALCLWQILCLMEVLACTGQQTSSIGPVVLAFIGSFYFFKTGHQATLTSIQWDSAFVPLRSVRYPWSPVLVVLNSFGAQILCSIAVPAVVLWKQPVKTKGLLGQVAKAMVIHVLVYATIGLATTVWAAWLRRHLMLYRIFSPRFIMGAIVLLVVEFVGAIIAVGGTRWSMMSVGDVFGWP